MDSEPSNAVYVVKTGSNRCPQLRCPHLQRHRRDTGSFRHKDGPTVWINPKPATLRPIQTLNLGCSPLYSSFIGVIIGGTIIRIQDW